MTALWKAVSPDYTTGGSDGRPLVPWRVGETVTHPTSVEMTRDAPATYLSLSTEPAETLIGGRWPCRLLRVEPVGDVIGSDQFPHKRCALSVRVLSEAPAHLALGPIGLHVAALIERARMLVPDDVFALDTDRYAVRYAQRCVAWDAARYADRYAAYDAAGYAARLAAGGARDAAWDAACDARYASRVTAWGAAQNAAYNAARDAAYNAVSALVVRDVLEQRYYDELTLPWRQVIGAIHPDDVERSSR